jgi:hypothetical protein
MRYRGPYEYDKFTLNILNYVNFVNDYIYDMNNTSKDYKTFKALQDEVNEQFEKMMENMDTVYKTIIMNKD